MAEIKYWIAGKEIAPQTQTPPSSNVHSVEEEDEDCSSTEEDDYGWSDSPSDESEWTPRSEPGLLQEGTHHTSVTQ